ncbi:MAG: TOPRIM nucleotidyl transferase/hydrolase domain-containing protein [Vampirovibrionales bacterium]
MIHGASPTAWDKEPHPSWIQEGTVWACKQHPAHGGGSSMPWVCPPPTHGAEGSLTHLQKQGYVRFRLPNLAECLILTNKLLKFRLPCEAWHASLASWLAKLQVPPRTLGIHAWESASTFSLLLLSKQLLFLAWASQSAQPPAWQPHPKDTLHYVINNVLLQEWNPTHWLQSELQRLQEAPLPMGIHAQQLTNDVWLHPSTTAERGFHEGLSTWLSLQGLPWLQQAAEEEVSTNATLTPHANILHHCLLQSMPPLRWLSDWLHQSPQTLHTLDPKAIQLLNELWQQQQLSNRPIQHLCLVEGETECHVLPALAQAVGHRWQHIYLHKVGGKQAMPPQFQHFRQAFQHHILVVLDADAQQEAQWLAPHCTHSSTHPSTLFILHQGALEDTYPLAFLLDCVNTTNHMHPVLTQEDVALWVQQRPLLISASAYQQLRQYAHFLGIHLLKKEALALAYVAWLHQFPTQATTNPLQQALNLL